MAVMFTYANVGLPGAPGGGIPVNCGVYICVDALGNDTLSLQVNINGQPSGPFNNAAHTGPGANPHEAGLYYILHQNFVSLVAPRDYLYEAINTADSSVLCSMTLTWLPPAVPPGCPDPTPDATPPPVLTAGLLSGGVKLEWTASHSADLHFTTIRYDVYKSTNGGSYTKITSYPNELFDTYQLLDAAVSVGNTYSYYVGGLEPVLGLGGNSNTATVTWAPPPVTVRDSWGMIAA